MIIVHQQDPDFPMTDAAKVREFLAVRAEPRRNLPPPKAGISVTARAGRIYEYTP